MQQCIFVYHRSSLVHHDFCQFLDRLLRGAFPYPTGTRGFLFLRSMQYSNRRVMQARTTPAKITMNTPPVDDDTRGQRSVVSEMGYKPMLWIEIPSFDFLVSSQTLLYFDHHFSFRVSSFLSFNSLRIALLNLSFRVEFC